MTRAYIGLGSNLEGPIQQLERAFEEIDALPHSRLLSRSSLYRSRPVDGSDQPDYVNAAALMETEFPAGTLLQNLMRIETSHGRIRGGQRWQARTLDLDLLLYGQHLINEDDLVVPHPEISKRNFVLIPLAEIAPGLVIPGVGVIEDLLHVNFFSGIQKID